MKWLYVLAVLVFLVTVEARADRVDSLESRSVTDYCMQKAEFFHGGVNGFLYGRARKVSQPTPEIIELFEHGVPMPKDSMWVVEWNQLTDREKAFMEKVIFEGWDEAKKLSDSGTKPDIDRMTQTYFEGCLYKRTKETHAPKTRVDLETEIGIKVASSSAIAKPSKETCDEIRIDVKVIGEAVSDGVPEDDLMRHARMAPDLESDRLERILRQIKEAYAWDGPFQEWIDKELKGCDNPN